MAEPQAITSAREYETIYVLRPDAGRETSENIGTRVLDVISKQHGSLTRVENWGYRKLAYPVRKHARGVYVYLKYVGDGALVSELERNLRLQDAVLKLQTVKLGKAAAAEAAKPEDIEFEHLEVVEDAEPEDSLAKTLGLEDVRDDYRSHHEAERETDDAEEEGPDLNNVGAG
jgi:small subunit ribosomal protein S6